MSKKKTIQKVVEVEVDDDTLSNFDINNFFKNPMSNKVNKHYGGCFDSDMILNVTPEEGKVYVVNLDNEDSEASRQRHGVYGTHWVGISNIRKNKIFYFDSFGMPPSNRCKTFMNKAIYREKPKEIVYNIEQLQDVNEDSCGYWVVYVLRHLLGGDNYDKLIDKANINHYHEWRNERLLKGLKQMNRSNIYKFQDKHDQYIQDA